MLNNPKVTIVVPIYNCEKYLEMCMESLVNQTLKDIEIVCVNDGTKDNSLEILEKYTCKDKRIKLIHQENQGLSAARNTGMTNATGEYVGFVDSDDWVDLDFFEKLYNAAKKYNSDIAAGDALRHGKRIKTKQFKYKHEKYFTDADIKIKEAKIPKLNYVWNKIYRREKILNHPFPVGFYFEDIGWSVKVVYDLDGFVTVPNTFYRYMKHPGTIVTQKSEKHKNDALLMEQECLNFFLEKNIKMYIPLKLQKRKKYKVCGLTVLLKEYYYPDVEQWKLLGVPVFKRREK